MHTRVQVSCFCSEAVTVSQWGVILCSGLMESNEDRLAARWIWTPPRPICLPLTRATTDGSRKNQTSLPCLKPPRGTFLKGNEEWGVAIAEALHRIVLIKCWRHQCHMFFLEGFWFAKFEEAHFMCRNSHYKKTYCTMGDCGQRKLEIHWFQCIAREVWKNALDSIYLSIWTLSTELFIKEKVYHSFH